MQGIILVTGGTGFLGSYVIRLLIGKGYAVRALRRHNSPMDLVAEVADRVEWVEADITDIIALEDAMKDVAYVMHCAAMVSFHPRDITRMMQVNVEGTANLINLSLDMGVKKFIHVSSIAAIGRTKERPQLDEKAKWVQSGGNSQYAISKYLGEQEAWRGDAEGLAVAIVNPAIVLGSGFWDQGSAKFFKQINDGLKFSPVGRTGFVDVRDVAQFMLLLLESEVSGERFILNAENILYRDFFKMIADALGAKVPPIPVTPFLAEVAWRVEWLKEKLLGADPLVTKETARSSVSSFFYSNEKSRAAFGFEYRPLQHTIGETGAQFLKAKQNGLKPLTLPLP